MPSPSPAWCLVCVETSTRASGGAMSTPIMSQDHSSCDLAQRQVFSLPCEPLTLVKQARVLHIHAKAHRSSSTVSYSALPRREVHSTSCPRLALQ